VIHLETSGNVLLPTVCCQPVASLLPNGANMQPTDRKRLTDRTLKSLKPAPKGKTEDHWDPSFPKFGVRVSDTGRKTFVLTTRYPGGTSSARRALGVYGPMSLADAHEKARD
jgi:hypothetical protein